MEAIINQENIPLICVPLTGKTVAEIDEQLHIILQKQPDMIEWRADFFEQIAADSSVLSVIKRIKNNTDVPLLFTIRSEKEEIGRASCRERVEIKVVEVAEKRKRE